MADVQPTSPLGATVDLGSAARLALAGAAGIIATNGAAYLQSHGIITDGQTADVISWGSAAIVGLATAAWAKFKNLHFGDKLNAAAATGDPKADPSTPATKAAVEAAIADPNSGVTGKPTS